MHYYRGFYISNLDQRVASKVKMVFATVQNPYNSRECPTLTSRLLEFMHQYNHWKALIRGFKMIPKSSLSGKNSVKSGGTKVAHSLSK